MTSRAGALTFVIDGEETNIALKPVGLMAVERKWGGDAFAEHPVEATMFAAWVTVGKPGGADGFDDWAAPVEEMVGRRSRTLRRRRRQKRRYPCRRYRSEPRLASHLRTRHARRAHARGC